MEKPRILCVDDEPLVLEGISRNLRRQFRISTAVGGPAGIEAIDRDGPFAAILSDMRMPEVDGIGVLRHALKVAPDTSRMLLTGHADLNAAITVVNEASIFRFLLKPCPPERLAEAIASAVAQHRLVTAERVLLEQTLNGSIRVLSEILATVDPVAFGRACRVRDLVQRLAKSMNVEPSWHVEIAAALSQLGSVVLPAETTVRLHRGESPNERERAMLDRLPEITDSLLAHIPRLEEVREILRHARPGPATNPALRSRPSLGARILRAALDLDDLVDRGLTRNAAIERLIQRGDTDPKILLHMQAPAHDRPKRELALKEMRPGLIIAEDVKNGAGLLLVARGQTVTISILERLRNMAPRVGLREPLICYDME
jgi:CheY-like chemotaxis protein